MVPHQDVWINSAIESVRIDQFYVGSLAGLLDEQIQCPTDIQSLKTSLTSK